MPSDPYAHRPEKTPQAGEDRPLSDAAKRAIAEADERRARYDAEQAGRPLERGGRNGPEPVRYGDWEVKGLTSDF